MQTVKLGSEKIHLQLQATISQQLSKTVPLYVTGENRVLSVTQELLENDHGPAQTA